MPIEIVFYIHGVSPEAEVTEHQSQYRAMHQAIAEAGVDVSWPAVDDIGGAEWGWNFDGGPAKSHQALAIAQRTHGERVLPLAKEQRDFTLNPTRFIVNRLRDIIFYGFGDMFYYVSSDGKWAIRLEVARRIVEHINERRGDGDEDISLTLVAHSAGSVIAFDFLYYVFSTRKHRFLPPPDDENDSRELKDCRNGLQQLREMAAANKLRLRRLIAFGSPIGFLPFRADAVVEILSRDERLRTSDYGLDSRLADAAPLSGPRLINLWDKDDPIAWPVAPLLEPSDLVEDVYVDVSDVVSSAHTAYWKSGRVHREIAARW